MKRFAGSLLLLSLVSTSMACNQAKFGGNAKKKTTPKTEDVVPETLELIVTTPSDSIRAGENTMQATASLKGKTEIPEVIWTLSSTTEDKGRIDEKGLYTSPAKAGAEFPVTLIATLKKDPKVKAQKTITVIPHEVIFVECMEGNQNFPIEAKVYRMNPEVKRLPDYANANEATYVTKVCMDNYSVEPRNFEEGFPKVSELFEYFSLQTTSTLIVEEEGDYHFQLNSDDGSRLYINGEEVIDNDGEHQAFGPNPEDSQEEGMKEAVVRLTKGEHKLALNYFQGPRFRIALVLKWKTPSSNEFVYVPRSSFK